MARAVAAVRAWIRGVLARLSGTAEALPGSEGGPNAARACRRHRGDGRVPLGLESRVPHGIIGRCGSSRAVPTASAPSGWWRTNCAWPTAGSAAVAAARCSTRCRGGSTPGRPTSALAPPPSQPKGRACRLARVPGTSVPRLGRNLMRAAPPGPGPGCRLALCRLPLAQTGLRRLLRPPRRLRRRSRLGRPVRSPANPLPSPHRRCCPSSTATTSRVVAF
jgi:hypothetical protein